MGCVQEVPRCIRLGSNSICGGLPRKNRPRCINKFLGMIEDENAFQSSFNSISKTRRGLRIPRRVAHQTAVCTARKSLTSPNTLMGDCGTSNSLMLHRKENYSSMTVLGSFTSFRGRSSLFRFGPETGHFAALRRSDKQGHVMLSIASDNKLSQQ
jgi:hypothetical protein